ncbi:hypothetical protein JYQ62_05115 [Nostoc sp. UHCC 0702]|nr:hypothetical protein JYQ62_05115 [Nostoc sp. UHCC 0702]
MNRDHIQDLRNWHRRSLKLSTDVLNNGRNWHRRSHFYKTYVLAKMSLLTRGLRKLVKVVSLCEALFKL